MSLKPDDFEYKINFSLSIPPIINSVDEINYYRNEYKKALNSLKKYQYFSEKPGDMIKTSFFHLGYHAKDNLELMKNTSELFRKIIPNVNYTFKNIDKPKKQKKIRVGFISEFLTQHTIFVNCGKHRLCIFRTYNIIKTKTSNNLS